jgi:hypothetical protein
MTAISNDIDKFQHHRYAVVANLIPKGGKEEDTIKLADSVTELRIVKHFDEQFMPYYRLVVGVSVDVAEKIQSAWRTGKMYITMRKYVAIKGETTNGVKEEDTGETYIKDGEFRIMVCDGAPPHVPKGQSNELIRQVPSVQFVMELAATVPLDINKSVNNGAYHEVTTAEMAAHIVSDSMPKNLPDYKFVMSTTDNPKRYESVFLPPLNFVPALRHIDKVYGMYKGTMCVFLDVDRGYVLSSTKATSAAKDEPKSVALELRSPEEASPDTMASGSAYEEEGKSFRLRTAQRIGADVAGPANRENNGESVKLVRSTTDERSGSMCKNLITDDNPPEGKKKEMVAWQCYDNPLVADRMRIQAREEFTPIHMAFESCDLGAFAPNLQWTLVTDASQSAQVEGQWRLRACEILLTKAPGSDQTSSVAVMAELVPAVSESPQTQDAARNTQAEKKAASDAAVETPPNPPSGAATAQGAGTAGEPAPDAPPATPAEPGAGVQVQPLPADGFTPGEPSPAAQKAMVEGAARNIGNMDSMIADTQGQVDSLTSRIRSMPPSAEREQLRQERAVLYNDISSFEASKARSQAVLDKYSPY